MKKYLIGTGGWAYFKINKINPLITYSKAFNFVEVNSTFYELPPLKMVKEWKKRVPKDFTFSVRAHHHITHVNKLQSKKEVFETFEYMKKICNVLNANILHFQMPPSVKSASLLRNNLKDFLNSVNLRNLQLALEIRGINPSQLAKDLVDIMRDNNIIHCVDLSKNELPAYKSDKLYSRLFGKGNNNIYQPLDEELKEIDRKVTEGDFEEVTLSFHYVHMYKDAARLKVYKKTGDFPKITKSTGLSSLQEVLSEDTVFPKTKQELIDNQGWKLFDLTNKKRIRADEFLKKLPQKRYNNINDVIDALYTILRKPF